MELDELRSQWLANDAQFDNGPRIDVEALQAAAKTRARARLRWAAWRVGFEVAMGGLAIWWLAPFLVANRAESRFLLPGALVAIVAAVLLTASIREFWMTLAIDYVQPVVEVQRRLLALRVLRLRTLRWIAMGAPLLWVPLVIVLLQGLLGVDAYVLPGVPWLLANLAFGILWIPLLQWLCRWVGSRLPHSPRARALLRGLSGSDLAAAIEQLQTVC